ncbi:receptor-type tyrosine-protein phosphatase H [Rhineura floridana]|uniref:receptor-type tyrosine-protein phosphatase H n=1 Tax=Rhineura floridana TaxID=261503 RepID=UPI002AC83319|nr:receptor-type tyrosine-protein phosphatase H [Rhineura floridana]
MTAEGAVLLLLPQPGQHGKNRETKTTIKPTSTSAVASTDSWKDHWKVTETFVMDYCTDDVNVTEIQRGPEVIAKDPDYINITNFSPGGQFNVTVDNNCSSIPNCTTCAKLCPVEDLTLGDRTNNSIILHWKNLADCCHMSSRANFSTVPNDSCSSCTAYISGLLPGQDYTMTVYRTLQNGRCSQETSINVTTMPSPVLDVEIQNRTVDMLEIGWGPPLQDPHVGTYRYRLCLLNCSITPGNLWLVRELEAGSTYSVEVSAITTSNVSSIVTTIQATTAPNMPENITVGCCSTNNFSISWNRPRDVNETAYFYSVIWFRENCTDPLGNKTTNGSSYTIKGLQPGKLYLVKLASNINGVKSKEARKWALTSPLPPTHFNIEIINQTAVALSWVIPSPAPTGFALWWKKSNESNENEKLLNTSANTTLNRLTASTNYTFTLLSIEKREELAVYSTGIRQKGATKPDLVNDVKCLALGGGYSLKLSWTCPSSKVSKFLVLVSGQICKEWLTCKESTVIDNLQPAKSYQIQVKTFWYDLQEASNPVECSTQNTGVIVGTVFAGLLLLVILSLLLFYFWRRRSNNVSEKQKADVALPRVLASVPVAAFPNYCCGHFSDSAFGFAKEYQQLQDTGTGQSQSVAERPENQAKNRYSNVLPYDHSRVQLTPKSRDPNSDYINASYIPGFERQKEFIAAQGPLPGTLYDFWRMIWDQQIMTLVMLTNCIESGRVKCEHYWPLDYTPCTYDDITVSVVTETILPDWTIRDFSIKRMNLPEVRLARHYHYMSWPDHGVPQITSILLRFRDLVRDHIEQHEGSGPALVHCSAGVGRTGTFIALDSLLRQAQITGEIGVFSFVQRMRMNRPLMVQTESQYVFLHQCLLDGIQLASQNSREKMEHSTVYENTLALQGYEVSRV